MWLDWWGQTVSIPFIYSLNKRMWIVQGKNYIKKWTNIKIIRINWIFELKKPRTNQHMSDAT